jgi:hypothetical protein
VTPVPRARASRLVGDEKEMDIGEVTREGLAFAERY